MALSLGAEAVVALEAAGALLLSAALPPATSSSASSTTILDEVNRLPAVRSILPVNGCLGPRAGGERVHSLRTVWPVPYVQQSMASCW
jgi:hypothetical protein